MTDVNVQISTQGDVTGLRQISSEYEKLIAKSKRQYEEFQRKSLEMASGLERKVMSGNLTLGGTAANVVRGVSGRAIRYGGAAAGIMGAYSLLSNIGGEMGGMEQRNLAYATALSATRGGQGLDYTIKKPFFEIQKLFEELGQTVYATSKDMVPMLEVAKELKDFSAGTRESVGGRLAGAVNLGRSLGVDPNVLSELYTGGLRRGSFQQGGQYVEMSKMMMLNQNMMHRSTEALQAMGQVLAGTTHGVQGAGAFGIFNLLDTMNASKNRAYWGAGGASAALRIDQAFRTGGDESFQYMQTLALNPAFQKRNARLAREASGITKRKTNWESGSYDQLMSDLLKDMGAFGTPEDLIKAMTGMGISGTEAESYVKKMYGAGGGGMRKMNIERLFDVYGATFGAEESAGKKFFMQMQMAKSMGVKPTDIGVIGEALKDPKFMERARTGKLAAGEYAEAYKAWDVGGKEGYEKWFQERAKNQESFITIAQAIRGSIDDIKAVVNEYLKPAAQTVSEWMPVFSKTIIKAFGTEEQKAVLEANELKKMGMGLPGTIYGDIATRQPQKQFRKKYGFSFLPEWMQFDPTGQFLHSEITGGDISPYSYEYQQQANRAPNQWQGRTVGGVDPNAGIIAVIPLLADAIVKGFEKVNIEYPKGTIPMDYKE